MLPGGFILKEEEMEAAAARILKSRTGLDDLFLQQFHVFGGTTRNREQVLQDILEASGIAITDQSWLLQRFISIGFYALAPYDKVQPLPDMFSTQCTWHDLGHLPGMLYDHRQIVEKALQALRLQLNHQPIGYNLLPEQFPLKSLQTIYETILGRKLERSNFNRKILSYGILEKKEKLFSGAAHKAPFLYSFNKQAYFDALKNGLEKEF